MFAISAWGIEADSRCRAAAGHVVSKTSLKHVVILDKDSLEAFSIRQWTPMPNDLAGDPPETESQDVHREKIRHLNRSQSGMHNPVALINAALITLENHQPRKVI